MDPSPTTLDTTAPGPRRPAGPRFHQRVARTMAAVALAAVVLLVLSIWLAGRGLMLNGMRLRAEGVAASTAAAMPRGGAPFDAASWADRVRAATTDAVAVLVRDAAGREVARAEVAEPEAGVVVALAPLAADAAVPQGSLEVRLDRSRLSGLLALAMAAVMAVGLALIAAAAWAGGAVARRLTGPVGEVAAAAASLAAGDLRLRPVIHGDDELGEVARSVAQLGAGLTRMIGDLRGAAAQVDAATGSIASTSRAQHKAVAGQSAALEQAASTVAEVALASRIATENAQLVIQVAERSEKVWQQGEVAVRAGMAGLSALEGRVGAIAEAVTELSDRTVQIAGIIATVKDLAEQSNVLALNAAIEAAKVGEAGQGFAVVAEEMRRLAAQSHRATDEVRARLGELQRATRKVVAATGDGAGQARAAVLGAEQASVTIGGLASALEQSSQAARGIADTTRRQTDEMERIATAVQYLHVNMGETLAGAQRIEEVAGELTRVSEALGTAVRAYRT